MELLEDGRKRDALRLWLERLRQRFAGRILALDEETLLAWGTLSADPTKRGRAIPPMNALSAACALRHNALLATRNVRDFDDTGAAVFNPWEAPGT